MSGRKQHYIPQRLLKEFAEVSPPGKKAKVWVYRNDRASFRTAIDGAAAERHFYSELPIDGTRTLDDRITDYENELGPTYEALRDFDVGASVPAEIASEFVTHLIIRNAHVRETLLIAFGEMTGAMKGLVSDGAWVREAIGVDRPDSIFSDALDEELAKLPALFRSNPQFRDLIRNAAIAEWPEVEAQMLRGVKGAFPDAAFSKETVRQKHIEILEKGLSPTKRRETLERLNWSVATPAADPAILPDCVAIFRKRGSESALPLLLMSNDDPVEWVVMPIASDRLLVGSDQPHPKLPVDLNVQFAGASQSFFVAKHPPSAVDTLVQSLGLATSNYLLATMSSITQEMRDDPGSIRTHRSPKRRH